MNADVLTALEWLAFGLGAVTVWCYGHSKMQGGVLGTITAIVFVLWGALAGVWGAVTINIGFFVLHARNLKRAINDANPS
jgi:hypothetical protein